MKRKTLEIIFIEDGKRVYTTQLADRPDSQLTRLKNDILRDIDIIRGEMESWANS